MRTLPFNLRSVVQFYVRDGMVCVPSRTLIFNLWPVSDFYVRYGMELLPLVNMLACLPMPAATCAFPRYKSARKEAG